MLCNHTSNPVINTTHTGALNEQIYQWIQIWTLTNKRQGRKVQNILHDSINALLILQKQSGFVCHWLCFATGQKSPNYKLKALSEENQVKAILCRNRPISPSRCWPSSIHFTITSEFWSRQNKYKIFYFFFNKNLSFYC